MSRDSATRRRGAVIRWASGLAVVAVLGVLLVRIGAAPFVSGVERLTIVAVLIALAATAIATEAAAWRWSAIGRAFGVPVPLRAAVPAYYRSQLLNTVLPGGVSGDLVRGLGGGSGSRQLRLKTVAWDRATGQAVQLTLLAVVLWVTTPVARGAVLGTSAALLGLVAAVVLSGGRVLGGRDSRRRRLVRTFRHDLRSVLAEPGALVPVIAGSVVVSAAHAAVFVLAAVVTGASGDVLRLLPLALLVQTAMVLPAGFAGFGAREGVAAALFAGAGLGAAQGVEAATAYGALALLAVVPGVIPLIGGHVRRGRARTAVHPLTAVAP